MAEVKHTNLARGQTGSHDMDQKTVAQPVALCRDMKLLCLGGTWVQSAHASISQPSIPQGTDAGETQFTGRHELSLP